MKGTRKGFTLVELLIVIVVIGILSAMMMLSSTEAVTSAKASNIVSNLRNLKTAALALYTDNMDKFNTKGETNPAKEDVFEYLNGGSDIPDKGQYDIVCVGTAPYTTWFIKYDNKVGNTATADETKIGEKLKGRAKSLGLLKNAQVTGGKVDPTLYDGGENVYVHVR